jgi:hypothetical protein
MKEERGVWRERNTWEDAMGKGDGKERENGWDDWR